MNRIILIGNGFDLAHKMKTSYIHFMNYYFDNLIEELKSAVNQNVYSYGIPFENEEIKVSELHGQWGRETQINATNFDELLINFKSQNIEFIFKNKFLEILTKKHQEKNWVDIEIEYYLLLKESFNNEKSNYKISDLNRDFNQIKKVLEKYLIEVENKFFAEFGKKVEDLDLKINMGSKMYSPFNIRDFSENLISRMAEHEFNRIQNSLEGMQKYFISFDELSEPDQKLISRIGYLATNKEVRELLLSDNTGDFFKIVPEELLFLNFNYTFTEKIYINPTEFTPSESMNKIKTQVIHIHGTTDKSDRNNVIFGFGDEIDEDYKSIENLNDNSYLENIKSINYLETDNYKRLLAFLNLGDYQIFIFGHSCGISDRTLLNTLFEHKNCLSIKPFYYKKDSETDNYIDLIKNISRNFNSKANMRDKVVNKEYCESLS